MTLAARDRRTIIAGAVILAVIVATRFAVIPWVDSWLDARRASQFDRRQLNEWETEIRRVLGQRKRLSDKYGPAVNQPLEDSQTARVSLFEAAQDAIKANSFEATYYEPQASRPLREIPGVQAIKLQVRGKCKLPELAKCLAAMRKADTLVIVDRLIIANGEKKPGQLEVTMMLMTLAKQDKARS